MNDMWGGWVVHLTIPTRPSFFGSSGMSIPTKKAKSLLLLIHAIIIAPLLDDYYYYYYYYYYCYHHAKLTFFPRTSGSEPSAVMVATVGYSPPTPIPITNLATVSCCQILK